MPKAPRLLAGVATALLTVALPACSGGNSSPVITVNGQAITHGDLDQKLEQGPAARGTLQQMVYQALIDQYAKDHNFTASDDDITKRLNQYYSQYQGQANFEQLLKARGMSMDDVKAAIREQVLLDKAVGGDIKISDAQIKSYFDKNHAQFDTPDQARARHILVPDLKTAEKVEADLKAGKDFAAEAQQYSQDPGSKTQGGELGWFRHGQFVAPFEKYAFSAPINQISPPIKSMFGYHVIQVEERKTGQKATLASTRDQIESTLRQQNEAPLIQPFIQQLQTKANITANDPAFASVFPSPAPAAATSAPAPAVSAAAPAPSPTTK